MNVGDEEIKKLYNTLPSAFFDGIIEIIYFMWEFLVWQCPIYNHCAGFTTVQKPFGGNTFS